MVVGSSCTRGKAQHTLIVDTGYWLPTFRTLHQRVRRGEADAAEVQEYHHLQDQLSDCLISAQNLAAPPGARARRDFRVACAFPLEVGRLDRAVTHDLSKAGFSALVPTRFHEGQEVCFSLWLGGGQKPVEGVARVVAMERDPQRVSTRVSFAFVSLDATTGPQLDGALFDAALARLA